MGFFDLRFFLRTARGRRAAVTTLRPMLRASEARLGFIPPGSLRTPYMIGYLSMLISIIAVWSTRGRLRGEELGVAQIEAWMQLTGQADDLIGEEICLLSADADPDFVEGCRNARMFIEAYRGALDPDVVMGALESAGGEADTTGGWSGPSYTHSGVSAREARVFGRGGPTAAALWRAYFDERL